MAFHYSSWLQSTTSRLVYLAIILSVTSAADQAPIYVTVTENVSCTSSAPTTTVISTVTSSIMPPSTMRTQPASSTASASDSAASGLAYSNGDVSPYLPCVPGTLLCNSATEFFTCTWESVHSAQNFAYGWSAPQSVASGMQCLPSLTNMDNDNSGQMSGAPSGTYRNDQYVRNRPEGSCSVDGRIYCNGAYDFWICDQGGWIDMGAVAAGTTCQDGQIT